MDKKVCIRTYGCQMNVYDSEKMLGLLQQDGFSSTNDLKKADLILINTCCVRQHAEDKVFSLLGKLDSLKRANPSPKIVMAGCMAQLHGDSLVKRFPGINLVLGTDDIFNLPNLIKQIERNPVEKIVAIASADTRYQIPDTRLLTTDIRHLTSKSGFVAIMRGCNRFCSYCVVPYVRGREWSRPAIEILEEIKYLIGQGIEEITLLGQNVNAYAQRAEGGGQKGGNPSPYPLPQGEREGVMDFADLLREVNKIQGLEKFSFLTSHPGDFSDKLIKTLRTLSKFSRRLHLPAQSGSDRILKLMRRGYTREEYLGLLEKIRGNIPGIRIGSDFIVGFPGEADEDFEQTYSLVKESEFSFAYMFKYSPRPGTTAALLNDDVPLKIKKERLARLLNLQKELRAKG